MYLLFEQCRNPLNIRVDFRLKLTGRDLYFRLSRVLFEAVVISGDFTKEAEAGLSWVLLGMLYNKVLKKPAHSRSRLQNACQADNIIAEPLA